MQSYFGERTHFDHRAPSLIQTRKRLGEGRKSVLGSRTEAERGVRGRGGGRKNSLLPSPLPRRPLFPSQHGGESTLTPQHTENATAGYGQALVTIVTLCGRDVPPGRERVRGIQWPSRVLPSVQAGLHMTNVIGVSKNLKIFWQKLPQSCVKDRHFETRSLYRRVKVESWGRTGTLF